MSAALIRADYRCADLTLVSLYDGDTWLEQRHWPKGHRTAWHATDVLPLSATWRESLHAVVDRPGVEITALILEDGEALPHDVRVEVLP